MGLLTGLVQIYGPVSDELRKSTCGPRWACGNSPRDTSSTQREYCVKKEESSDGYAESPKPANTGCA